jgi:hypothetical protein
VLNSGENDIAIDARLAKGAYILEAISNGGRSTTNLVIE